MPSRVSFAAYASFPLWAILLLNKESPLMMSSPTVQDLSLLSFHMHWPRCQFHSCGRAYFSLCWFCLELIARWVKKPNSYILFPWNGICFNSFQFSTVEVVITSLKDGFGDWIDRYIKRHEILVLIVCVLGFLCGIPYIFNVRDFFVKLIFLIFISYFVHLGWCILLPNCWLLQCRNVPNVHCLFRMHCHRMGLRS